MAENPAFRNPQAFPSAPQFQLSNLATIEPVNREYHKWLSPALGREMELLVFGHAGPPALAFSTSCGRFFDFENFGMVAAVQHRLDTGNLQIFCVDSVDAESWYNRTVVPRARLFRHLRFEHYLLDEVVPFVRYLNCNPSLAAVGCSFGGYHAVNIGLRHPEIFSSILSMGGALDPSGFLSGYYDQDCYLNLPTHYMPNMHDAHYFHHYRRNTCVLATGVNDVCREMNQQMAHILHTKEIPCQLDVWGDNAGHDWHTWQRMIQAYL